MTRLEVTIAPGQLDALREALAGHPWVTGLTVQEVKGHGPSGGHLAVHRGAGYAIAFVPEVRVELVVPDPLVPRMLHEISSWVRTGAPADGKILVTRIDEVVRVRTGERGEGAL